MCKNLINQKQKNWIENLNQGSQTEELTSSPPLSFFYQPGVDIERNLHPTGLILNPRRDTSILSEISLYNYVS